MYVDTSKMNRPSTKGSSGKEPRESADNGEINAGSETPQLEKQPYPIKQFLLACLCILVGTALFMWVSTFASVNPDPLKLQNTGFTIESLNYKIERNAPMRLPIIVSDSSIEAIANANSADLAIRLTDGQDVLLLTNIDSNTGQTNYSIQSPFNNEVTRDLVIEFDAYSTTLDEDSKKRINEFLQSNKETDLISAFTVYGFSNTNSYGSETSAGLSLSYKPLVDSIKNPQKFLSAFSAPIRRLKAVFGSPGINQQFAAEEKKKEEPKTGYKQQQIPQGQPDYSRLETEPSLNEQVVLVRDYLKAQLLIENPEHQSTISITRTVQKPELLSINRGVIIQLKQNVDLQAWQPIPEGESVFPVALTNAGFQIVNGNVINRILPNESLQTIAVLSSALDNFYGANTDYSELSPQTYPSVLSLIPVIIGIFAALYVLAHRKELPDADIMKKQLLVDSFVSDAPANDLSQDKLGFTEIASALSRFLRNTGTKAPLTLSIVGAWGSGKSSLMYFLKENLASFHMHPVWVNAWHHQNEEQFLAGLLNAIREHAIPPAWTSAGLLYRWNLMKMRWSEAPGFYYSFAFLFLGSLTFILTSNAILLAPVDEFSLKSIPFLSALIGAYPIVRAGMDRISTLTSSGLVQSIFGGSKRNLDMRANVGLREKFAKEFGMLCDALGDSTLTIFIDDLDRCKEQRIMDVMETINYLVSSGDCFIVISMEREPVENAIITYYKNTHSELDAAKLQLKARRYLEKIINIEIPVPNASVEQFNALVKVVKAENKPVSYNWLKPVVLVVSLFASIVLGHYLASLIVFEEPKTVATESAKSNAKEGVENTSSPIETPVEPKPSTETKQKELLTLQHNRSENKTQIILIPLFILVLIGMVIRAERYRQRKRIVENDSEPFLAAISVWAQVMGLSKKTPRSIKRFVNRTRFLAMRNAVADTNIKEENLVTLAALIDLAKDKGMADLESIRQHLPAIGNAELKAQMDALIAKSQAIDANKREQLQRWIRGVNVS